MRTQQKMEALQAKMNQNNIEQDQMEIDETQHQNVVQITEPAIMDDAEEFEQSFDQGADSWEGYEEAKQESPEGPDLAAAAEAELHQMQIGSAARAAKLRSLKKKQLQSGASSVAKQLSAFNINE